MTLKLLPPIDLTGEPTVWAYQDLQFWDALDRKWRTEPVAAHIGPARVAFRLKVSDLERWDPFAAWDQMREGLGGYRARLLVWHEAPNGWRNKRVVETRDR